LCFIKLKKNSKDNFNPYKNNFNYSNFNHKYNADNNEKLSPDADYLGDTEPKLKNGRILFKILPL